VRAYWAIMSARFRMLLQYRAAAAAGLGTQLFWGLIRVMIFEGFYRSSGAPQPMSYRDVVTYVWLGQGLLGLLLWSIDAEVRTMVRAGMVAYELLRPLDLYTLWYVRSIAARAAPTALRAGPLLLLAWLFFGMQLPPSWGCAAGWAAATLGALLLGSALYTLTTISILWTISGEGVSRLMPALVYMLSGMLVPIPLFPAWAQWGLNFLPFRGLADVPFRVYMGHIPSIQVPAVLFHQLAWTVALVILGRWILARGTRRLVVQGG
jgi:ABC-2 type transport system permease protein